MWLSKYLAASPFVESRPFTQSTGALLADRLTGGRILSEPGQMGRLFGAIAQRGFPKRRSRRTKSHGGKIFFRPR
jgi:hypothetical protein